MKGVLSDRQPRPWKHGLAMQHVWPNSFWRYTLGNNKTKWATPNKQIEGYFGITTLRINTGSNA